MVPELIQKGFTTDIQALKMWKYGKENVLNYFV